MTQTKPTWSAMMIVLLAMRASTGAGASAEEAAIHYRTDES
jgi:hypothetical protein